MALARSKLSGGLTLEVDFPCLRTTELARQRSLVLLAVKHLITAQPTVIFAFGSLAGDLRLSVVESQQNPPCRKFGLSEPCM